MSKGGVRSRWAPVEGAVLGRYRLGRLLGEGGMGAVYEATHEDLGKRVAIKTLHVHYVSQPDARQRFLQEGQAAARIRHAHVADVYDVGIDGDHPYLVIELLEGEDLASFMEREGPLSVQAIADLLVPVVAAVAAAHDQGVLHRDLKPKNIFLCTDRTGIRPKVLDFGISKLITSTPEPSPPTGTGVVLGTPHYMSPEQAQGAKDIDWRSDQYSIGVILYESVTGRRPMHDAPLHALLHRTVQGDFPPPRQLRPGLPSAFEALILKAMARRADARFATTRALGVELLGYASARLRDDYAAELGDDRRPPASAGVALPADVRAADVRAADERLEQTASEASDLMVRVVGDSGRVVLIREEGESAENQANAAPATAVVSEPARSVAPPLRRRASIAVMPFLDTASSGQAGWCQVADGMTEDIITALAKLRVLFVIARGTVYALGKRGMGAQAAGRILNVDYVASGSVRRQDGRISVVIELAETQDARIIWTDEFDSAAADMFSVLDAIVHRIVAAIAEEIESAECNRAILKSPSSLDAWEAYHRGLWHMYKFNAPDNRHAEQFFRGAIQLDPTFARAHAGMSFTHFQNVFLDLTPDRDRQTKLALEAAVQSLGADDRDPAAHWAMGRALWLNGAVNESFTELQRSIELSPNFALGHYTLGFFGSQAGDPRSAIDATDYSRHLSPFDPLQFAMLANRALAHVRLGELEEAGDWAVKATRRPNGHAHTLAIAAECLALANRRDEARKLVAQLRERVPTYSVEDFLRAFRFPRDTEKLFRRAARQIGFDSSSTVQRSR
jgi:TolB-like protein